MSKKLLDAVQPYDSVVWDWNGTLLNDLHVVLETEAEQFAKYGITPLTLEERGKKFCFPIQKYYESVGFDFTRLDFARINTEFMEIYERRMKQAPLFEGTVELLSDLKTTGKKQFVLSAASQNHLDAILKTREIGHFFDGIYGLPNNKAESKIDRGRELLAEHRIEPARTLLVGDTDHDLEVAKALGFDALLVADGHKSYDHLATLHHAVLKTRFTE